VKQQALHAFSAAALKGHTAPMHRQLLQKGILALLHTAGQIALAWLLCTQTKQALPAVTLWCLGCLLLRTGYFVLSGRITVRLHRHCLAQLGLSCASQRAAYRRLLHVTLWEVLFRFLLRIPAAGAVWCAGFLLRQAAAQTEGLYALMGCVQVLPVLLGIMLLRLRLTCDCAAAKVLCIRYPEAKLRPLFRTAHGMLKGQARFLLLVLLRCLPWQILPGMLPRWHMTLTAYFSVRCLEWQYQQPERRLSYCERPHIHCPYPNSHAAGTVSTP
jgi:hypothetical protein